MLGNNQGGSSGQALAWGVFDTLSIALGPGDYGLTLTGTIKGNNATSPSQSFSITNFVDIDAEQCE
jgi:hypothetical protein